MSICCLDFGGLHVYLQHTTPGYYLHLNCLQTVFINSLFLTTSHLYTTVTLTWDIFQLGFRSIQEKRRIIICWVSSTLTIKFLLEEIPGWKIKKHITTILHCSVFIISLSRQASVWSWVFTCQFLYEFPMPQKMMNWKIAPSPMRIS